MKRRAVVDARGDRLFVSSWSTTEYGATVQDDWIEVAGEPVPDAVLGGLVRSALANSRTGIPHPDYSSGPTPAVRKLWKLANVRSESAFERGTHALYVKYEDSTPDLVVMPYRNGGRRSGFTEMLDQAIILDARADDVMLGTAVRRALGIASEA